jgi:hypothetical protein
MVYQAREDGLAGRLLEGLDCADAEYDGQYLPDFNISCEGKRCEKGVEESVDGYGEHQQTPLADLVGNDAA